MNAITILNREFKHPADGWYQIERRGFFPATADDGRKVVQVIDEKALASIVNRFNTAAAAGALTHGAELLIDHEHFRHQRDARGQKNGESRAYGWVKSLRATADGLEMQNRWSATGQAAVDGGDYRFFSTEYDEQQPGEVWQPVPAAEVPLEIRNKFPGFEFLRPLQLTGLTLTNDHNNKGQRPITVVNRHSSTGAGAPGGSQPQPTNKNTRMKSVCTLLGLSPDAAEDAVLAEVTKLKNRNAALEPLATENLTLKNRNTELEGEQCDGLMDAHGLKADAPARVTLKPVLLTLKNREARTSFLKDCVIAPAASGKGAQTQLHNRNTKPPAGESAVEEVAPDSDAAREQSQKQEVAIRTYKLTNRCTYDQARNAVRQEKPELFGLPAAV